MPLLDIDIIVKQMRILSANKAARNYDTCRGLVIWINPPDIFFQHKLSWEDQVRGGEPAALAFAEVWAYWGDVGSLLWLNEVAQTKTQGEEF